MPSKTIQGRFWPRWFPAVRGAMIASQQPGGHWVSNHGEAYGTAMAVLSLVESQRPRPVAPAPRGGADDR